MTPTKSKKQKIKVMVMSHDSWSGPEVQYTKEFATMKGAENFANKINGKNTATVVPEYYETAHVLSPRGTGGTMFVFDTR